MMQLSCLVFPELYFFIVVSHHWVIYIALSQIFTQEVSVDTLALPVTLPTCSG